MKRIVAISLACVLVLGLFACGTSTGENTTGPAGTTAADQPAVFMAGFGKADITPQESGVPMNGYSSSSERLSTGLWSYLYAISVAVQDTEGNTAVVCSIDHAALGTDLADSVRDWAQKELGIPRENILISSIHQHSCPDPINGDFPSSTRYREYMLKGIKDSIAMAVEDLAPAEMYMNKVTTEAMGFVRHYWLKDGGHVTSHTCTGDLASGFDRYESEADKEMRLLKFTREEKEDIIIVNFQCHPHMGGGGQEATNVHSDWPGIMRDAVTEELGVNCVYFSGAGGNMNSDSANPADNVSVDYKDHGRRAAAYVVGAEDGYTKVSTGKVACKEITVTYEADHSMDYLVTEARVVADARSRSVAEAKELLKNYPQLHSIFHASAIVSKAAEGPTRNMTISAITFGDVAFTCHPYEMFDTNGMELRGGTVGNENYDEEDQLENPYAMTMIASLGNGTHGYVPSRLGYTNGGYSTDITKFAPGTGEQIVGDMLGLLNELHD